MEQTDDIDILLTLNSHGWSNCFLFVRDKKLEFTLTHVFSDPYVDLIHALSDLIRGQNYVSFFWYGEPGGYRIEIKRILTQQHKVIVSVSDFGEAFHEEPKSFYLQLEFEIKLKQIIGIFYFQLLKTYILLQDKQFAQNRANDFPFHECNQFERLVKQYMDY